MLAQYATPEELLLAPADDFVEDFVGADRGLKRLALQRVRDDRPVARAARARRRADGAGTRRDRRVRGAVRLLVDDCRARRSAGSTTATSARRGARSPPGSPVVTVEPEDVLRDALSHLLQEGVHYGAVVDPAGAVLGILSITLIEELLRPRANVRRPHWSLRARTGD